MYSPHNPTLHRPGSDSLIKVDLQKSKHGEKIRYAGGEAPGLTSIVHPQATLLASRAVAIAASAGGLQPLRLLISQLPANFQACIFVVQHLQPDYPSMLAQILASDCRLTVREARPGDVASRRTVLIAPPDRHLIVCAAGTISLTQTERVHFVRPCADLLFESVAARYNQHATAVVLSGKGVDGANGIIAIKRKGGMTIAQDESSCAHFGMPAAAIATGCVDFVLNPALIADKLLSTGEEHA